MLSSKRVYQMLGTTLHEYHRLSSQPAVVYLTTTVGRLRFPRCLQQAALCC